MSGGPRPAPLPHAPGEPVRQSQGPRDQHAQRGSNLGPQHGAPSRSQPPRDSRPFENTPHTSSAAPTSATAVVEPSDDKSANQKAYEEIFERGIRFEELGLSPEVVQGLTEAGFEYPTSIQARIIPIILSGKDVLGQAKTGTGKTAAFGLPLLSKCRKGVPFNTLLLVPTRELAIQVSKDLLELGRHTGLRVLPVYGGQNIATQAKLLERGPEIVVATPGRMMDMVERRYFHYNNVQMVVLDEVDRMLDIGFRDDIKRILSSCPRTRQTVFVSATLQPEIESLARSYANDCEKIVATAGALTVAMVKQFHLTVEPWDKKQLLLHLLTHEEPALTIVFCRTKRTVDNLSEYLMRKGIEAHAMHGDMPQNKRNRVIEKLHTGALSVLIASDLASRGLDVDGITHVINYDLPEDPDLYVHRIGRTARAGRDGIAWALVTPEQGPLLTEIEMLINAEIPKLDYPDFKPGPVPQDVRESRELGVKRVEMAKSYNRYAATNAPPAPSATQAAADPSRFPGGIVPSKMPPKRMMGRVKTARSVKAAIQQTFTPQPTNQPTNQPSQDAGSSASVDAPEHG